MDAAVMPFLRRRGSPSGARAGLQPWQFHENPGDAEDHGAMVADQPAGEADQVGAKVVSHGRYITFQDGRGWGAAADVPGHPVADRPAAGAAGTGMTRQTGSDARDDDGRGAP